MYALEARLTNTYNFFKIFFVILIYKLIKLNLFLFRSVLLRVSKSSIELMGIMTYILKS